MCGRENDSGAPQIKVTPEMIRAGVDVLWASGAVEEQLDSDELLVSDIFHAMIDRLPLCGLYGWLRDRNK